MSLQILKTTEYDRWFSRLKDLSAKAKINALLRRIELTGEIVGDYKAVGESVLELRFDVGPGYRVYLTENKGVMVLLLIGGDKSTQQLDIEKAKTIAREWRQSK